MRVLVAGSGGREHALVWRLLQSPGVEEVVCAPGNGGIAGDARCHPVDPKDHAALAALVSSERLDCVVVGPEGLLAEGLADHLRARGIPVLGPSREAARLEASKVFAKEFMARHGIPTAAFHVFTEADAALSFLASQEARYPIVVKADGLAAGKGVIVAGTRQEARRAVRRIMVDREFGAAGDRVVLEDCLQGSEASYIVFTDGESILPAVAAQDHKAVLDGDRGPNTGGMGAFSTDSILGQELESEVLDRVIRPTIDGMRSEGRPFQGILYAGLMLTGAGPQVLEFNVRMGDPEAQVILPRLESDFGALCEKLVERRLSEYRPSWSANAALCVVLASGGYPGPYETGKVISGLEQAAGDRRVAVFHAGTRRDGQSLLTAGGRVLGVTATAPDLSEAMSAAYEAVDRIHFEGVHFRRDIGLKGLRQAG
ncbi:MAG: phosphoribosylamine--glycine ligase [Acidobacteria bacterium]|nr:phosphoribosylamine--glycine ligase [Acidobacteriota bacterium]